MNFGVILCSVIIGAIVYFVGFMSGAITMNKIDEERERQINEEIKKKRLMRKLAFQERQRRLEGRV